MVEEGLRKFFENLTPLGFDLDSLAGLADTSASSLSNALVAEVLKPEDPFLPRSEAVTLGDLAQKGGRTHRPPPACHADSSGAI